MTILRQALISGVILIINKDNPGTYESGYCTCICKYPIECMQTIEPFKGKYHEVTEKSINLLTKISLNDINIMIEDEAYASCMNVSDFKRFTKGQELVFDANIVFGADGILRTKHLLFTDRLNN